jgi:8-oxo-dGTP pyrophosphatase MutT (NUDIX family)
MQRLLDYERLASKKNVRRTGDSVTFGPFDQKCGFGNWVPNPAMRLARLLASMKDDEGRVVMIRQYRHATSGYLLEVPAGTLDPGEAPEACAVREVEEETGYRAARLDPLGWIWTTPGFTNEKIWLYRATGLTLARSAHESDEIITVERLPLDEAVRLALGGEITDAKSVCALLRASSLAG